MIPCNIVKSCLSAAYVERAKFLGSDGWKEQLLEVIDADQLPAFLGGKRTDPDGNPLCIKSLPGRVRHGKDVRQESEEEGYWLYSLAVLLTLCGAVCQLMAHLIALDS
ncbi:hypothetical protein AVEN_178629-1 [Araneus ventricosus]|uniref:Uncharacterized protein n=1 Tax=Araneus ventricosus TaxID=182803 RepID=A0A4Y2JUM6_ARAVE|nr:hypothetical protein AVEN_177892-1 [Araneus ventricosus]GBM94031.1 hypothetical protein AVEN_178629-1 [Araneus ventricosus]